MPETDSCTAVIDVTHYCNELQIFASSEKSDTAGQRLWSLKLYNEHHFFSPNEIKRCPVRSGT